MMQNCVMECLVVAGPRQEVPWRLIHNQGFMLLYIRAINCSSSHAAEGLCVQRGGFGIYGPVWSSGKQSRVTAA